MRRWTLRWNQCNIRAGMMLIYAKYRPGSFYKHCCGWNKEHTLISEPSRECTVPITARPSPADSGTQSAALQGLDVSIWCYCRAGLSRADTAMFFFVPTAIRDLDTFAARASMGELFQHLRSLDSSKAPAALRRATRWNVGVQQQGKSCFSS